MQLKQLNRTKPVKSLSSRSFVKSSSRDNPLRAATHLRTETLEPQTFVFTKRQAQLFAHTSRVIRPVREKEEVQHENRQLKMQVNKLKEEITLEKTRRMNESKSISRINRKLDIEFEKEHYYEDNRVRDNLHEGLRYQYRKMRKLFEDKCQQYDSLAMTAQASTVAELTAYIQQLEVQAARLIEKVRACGEATCDTCSEPMSKYNYAELKAWQNEQKQKSEADTEKIELLKRELKRANDKIAFLDRLVIEKDNDVQYFRRVSGKYQRELEGVARERGELQKALQEVKHSHQESMSRLRDRQNRRLEAEKKVMVGSMLELQKTIDLLQSENKYFRTVIRNANDPSLVEESLSSLKLARSQRKISVYELNSEKSPSKGKKSRHDLTNKNESSRHEMSQLKLMEDHKSSFKFNRVLSDESLKSSHSGGQQVRAVKCSRVRQSEKALRMRRVNPAEIEAFHQELLYRLIASRVNIDQIKLKFDYNLDPKSEKSREDYRWKLLYISMKEVTAILSAPPFQLKPEEATLLGRYVVEDQSCEYAYCDEDNEIERTIAKSIIKAYLGEYSIPDGEEAEKEWEGVLGKYGKNLQLALGSLAPSGMVSKAKLLEICRNIQIELSPPTQDWLVGQLLSRSPQGLHNLQYSILFV